MRVGIAQARTMNTQSQRRIILITGATRGIGFATARQCARRGETVFLGARDPERGHAAATRLREEGLVVADVTLDVTKTDTIAAAADRIASDHGRLDVLVNNAGVATDRRRAPADLPIDELRTAFETNVLGAAAVTNGMLPLLRRSDRPVIGNVTSGWGSVSFLTNPPAVLARFATRLAYSSSKAALNALTLVYARALADEQIVVNALSPGFCATDLNGFTGPSTAEQGGAWIAEQVLDRAHEGSGLFFDEKGGTYPW